MVDSNRGPPELRLDLLILTTSLIYDERKNSHNR